MEGFLRKNEDSYDALFFSWFEKTKIVTALVSCTSNSEVCAYDPGWMMKFAVKPAANDE